MTKLQKFYKTKSERLFLEREQCTELHSGDNDLAALCCLTLV
jgi:hypothetical protein